jgi:cysteine-S-conjugate beta-lyase
MKTITQLFHPAPGSALAVGSTSTPIYQTATFAQPSALESGDYDYTRSGNPTRGAVEQKLALLEQAKFALSFTTGMAALSTLTRLVPAGGRILACNDLYGGTWRMLAQLTAQMGVEVEFINTTDLVEVETALALGADLLILETPSNPRLQITDLRGTAALCQRADCLLAVDNSLMSPLRQLPLGLGVDIVMHSATKFLAGHGDVSAGVLLVNDPALADRLSFCRNAEGNALPPFECWLLDRGLQTLHLRVREQQRNAIALAEVLRHHPVVKRLYWTEDLAESQKCLHQSQCSGPGSVLSFETGSLQRSAKILDALQCFSIAVSFGSVASTISLPCRMSHASMPEAVRRAQSLPEDLIRISVGIEDIADLKADLLQALNTL